MRFIKEFRFKKISHMSIGGKIAVGYGAMLVLMVGIGIFSENALRRVSAVGQEVATVALPSTQLVSDLNLNVSQFRLAELQHLIATSEEEMTQWEQVMDGEMEQLQKSRESLETKVTSEEVKKSLKEFDDHWGSYLGQHVQFVSASRQDKKEDATKALQDVAFKEYSAMTDILEKVTKIVVDTGAESAGRVESINASSKTLIRIAIFVALLVSVFTAWITSRSVTSRITGAVSGLVEVARQVTGASQQIAAMSNQSASSAAQQASALQETASSIQELSEMVARNADNAVRSLELSRTSHEKADRGQVVVERMIQSMDEVAQSNGTMIAEIEDSNQQFSQVTRIISEIANRTKVINEIVFQTKLLSFNASVEAARAGEMGKGFAVVAEEVGNLARMSGQAAQDITGLLDESAQKVDAIVAKSRSGVARIAQQAGSKVESARAVANECGEVLKEIVSHAGEVNKRVEEIAQASREQSSGIASITTATQQLDRATQETAAAAEESSASAQQLAGQADLMSNMLTEVRHAVFGVDENSGHDVHFVSTSADEDDQSSRHAA